MAQVGLLEDNPRIAKLCATLLHFAGHEVTIYETSIKCLRALAQGVQGSQFPDELSTSLLGSAATHHLPVDVLIMDLSLPDIDGIDVLRYLTSHSHTQTLPLILCTAATNSDLVKARCVAPLAGIVEKPFRLQTLVSAISTALEATSNTEGALNT